MGDDFRDREYHLLASNFVATASQLGTRNKCLDHHLVALLHRQLDGWSQLIQCLYFRNSKAAAARIGFHETRKTYMFYDLVICDQILITLAYHQTLRNIYTKAFEVLV